MKVSESLIPSKLIPNLANSQITSITPIEVISTAHEGQYTNGTSLSQSGTFHFPSITNKISVKSTGKPIETIIIDNDPETLEPTSGQEAMIIPQSEPKADPNEKETPSDMKIEPLEVLEEPKQEAEKDAWNTVNDDDVDSGPEIVEIIEGRDDSDGDGFHLSNDVQGKNQIIYMDT